MLSHGMGDDDRRSPCPKCKEYIDTAQQVIDNVDAINNQMEEIKAFLATNEWVLIENVLNIQQLKNPEKDMDMESLQAAHAQSVRFKRLVDSMKRALARLSTTCEEFGGYGENL
jgi:hypothetical protein